VTTSFILRLCDKHFSSKPIDNISFATIEAKHADARPTWQEVETALFSPYLLHTSHHYIPPGVPGNTCAGIHQRARSVAGRSLQRQNAPLLRQKLHFSKFRRTHRSSNHWEWILLYLGRRHSVLIYRIPLVFALVSHREAEQFWEVRHSVVCRQRLHRSRKTDSPRESTGYCSILPSKLTCNPGK
jgi:hypothetical protein